MSKIPSLDFQIEIWAIVFSVSSLINFKIVYIWPIWPKVWTRGFGLQFLCFVLFFSSTRELHSVWDFEYWKFLFFVKLWLFCPNWSYQGQKYRNVAIGWKGVSALFLFSSPILDITPFLRNMQPLTSSWHHPLRGNTRFYNDTLE